MQEIKDLMLTVEQVASIDVKSYLNWGDKASAIFKYFTGKSEFGDDYWYIGEMNSQTNKADGRGIGIWSNGQIVIKRCKNASDTPGKYLEIWNDGTLKVGEFYTASNGYLKDRYTVYFITGTSAQVGYD